MFPLLPALDIDAHVRFFLDQLGFTIAEEYDGWDVVQRGPVTIRFCQPMSIGAH